MYLELYIDGEIVGQWYLDDDVEFKKPLSQTFQARCEQHRKVIDDKVEQIKYAHSSDIAASKYWSIILSVKSMVRRINLNLT